ncbi:MAG: cytochrome c [Gammaproteobacteria bacterium]
MNALTPLHAALLLGLGAIALPAHAADAPAAPASHLLPKADGAGLYVSYCAVCHGPEARGDGPLASGLTIKPSNLRRLAIANGGEFPADRVRAYIDGRDLPLAHGTREMPIWGEGFKVSRGAFGERRVQERIDALVDWLRARQER